MYPDWFLLTNIIMGFVGVLIGVLISGKNIKYGNALKIYIPLVVLGFLIIYFVSKLSNHLN
jgi:hypothetical protein